jgi:hypothetical protein
VSGHVSGAKTLFNMAVTDSRGCSQAYSDATITANPEKAGNKRKASTAVNNDGDGNSKSAENKATKKKKTAGTKAMMSEA